MRLPCAARKRLAAITFRTYGYQRPEYANWPGQNPIANRLGTWDGTRQVEDLTWRTNGAVVGRYTECGVSGIYKKRVWHTQSMVQLPSKNGRAYFARTDSFRRQGAFYVMRTDLDAYDPATDYAVNTAGTDGEVVYR